MTKEELANKIRELVKENKLLEAGHLLINSEFANEGLSQSRRIKDLMAQIRTGQISFNDGNIEKNRISSSLLEAADFLDNQNSNLINSVNKPQKNTLKQLLIFIGLLIIIITLFYYLQCNKKQNSISETILSDAELQIVDAEFLEEENGQPTLDILLRNVGKNSAVIKRIEIDIIDSYKLRYKNDSLNFLKLEVSWTGNISLPKDTVISLKEYIEPHGADRIQLKFYSYDIDIFYSYLYLFQIKLIYNENSKIEHTEPILLFMPPHADDKINYRYLFHSSNMFYQNNINKVNEFVKRSNNYNESLKEILIYIEAQKNRKREEIKKQEKKQSPQRTSVPNEELTPKTEIDVNLTPETEKKQEEENLHQDSVKVLEEEPTPKTDVNLTPDNLGLSRILDSLFSHKFPVLVHDFKEHFVSLYSRTSPEEDFAEFFSAYTINTLKIWILAIEHWKKSNCTTVLLKIEFFSGLLRNNESFHFSTSANTFFVSGDLYLKLFREVAILHSTGLGIEDIEKKIIDNHFNRK